MGQSNSTLIQSIKTTPRDILVTKVNDLLVNGEDIDVNLTDENGKTALHFAAVEVALLLDAGASVNVMDNYQFTPVCDAAFGGSLECLKILTEKGKADFNIPNRDGMTPLHWAVTNKKYNCVEYLIKKGANVEMVNSAGKTFLAIAATLKSKSKLRMDEVIKKALDEKSGVKGVPIGALENFAKLRTQRLAALCRLWGVVKYVHPYLSRSGLDWDDALVKVLPLAGSALSVADFKIVTDKLLGFLQDPNTYCVVEENRLPLSPIPNRKSNKPTIEQPFVKYTSDNIAVVKATHHEVLNDFSKMVSFLNSVKDANSSRATAIIFDLRLKQGNKLQNSYPFKFMFFEAFRELLSEPLNLPCYRQRTHNGLPQQRNFGSVFHSGVYSQEGEQILPNPEDQQDTPRANTKKPWIFIVNKGTPESLIDLALATQIAGFSKVVYENDSTSQQEPGIASITIPLSGGLVAHVRKMERLNPDGSVGFKPDLVVENVNSKKDDTLPLTYKFYREGGFSVARDENPKVSAYVIRPEEKEYYDTSLPDKEHRILALFKYWNAIQYFFPYRDLMSFNWDEALLDFIPKIEKAKGNLEYSMTFLEAATLLGDSHATVASPILAEYLGTHTPPIELKTVEGKTVVSYVEEGHNFGLALGTEVVAIDGENTESRLQKLESLTPASTPQSLEVKIHQRLLAGPRSSIVQLKIQNQQVEVVQLNRTHQLPLTRKSNKPQYCVLQPTGYGYIDCVNLTIPNVEIALHTIRFTPALILDMRGHPKGTIYHIAPRLTKTRVTTAVTLTPFLLPQSLLNENGSQFFEDKHEVNPGSWQYEGLVVALISGETVSQAEHCCLYLKECANVTFIGSSTSGANGNVTNLALPGGVLVGFTGLGVLHADKSQLQRKGISPHVQVQTTLTGVTKGRDEILEAALAYLNETLLKKE